MKKRVIIRASRQARRRANIKASVSGQEMLDAFEAKLAELGIDSCTKVEASTGDPEMDRIMEQERAVEIYGEDWHEKYEDVGSGFYDIVSLGELKQYWNENNIGDPVLAEYRSFDDWWRDTRSNYLAEYHLD